jgi:hypothetical protein
MYDWENLHWAEAASKVQERNPGRFGWGYFLVEGMPYGIGNFFWFDSPKELLAFLVQIEPELHAHSLDKEQRGNLRMVLKKIQSEADMRNGLTEQLQKRINDEIDGEAIVWWGTFSELCAGGNEFSDNFITDFFERIGEAGKDTTVITAKYIPRFIKFLQE